MGVPYLDAEGADGPSHVLDRLLHQVLKVQFQFIADMITHCPGDDDRARVGQPFQASSDVDSIAIYIVGVDDNVANIHPDAEGNVLLGRKPLVPICSTLLNFNGATNAFDNARKLGQYAITRFLDERSSM